MRICLTFLLRVCLITHSYVIHEENSFQTHPAKKTDRGKRYGRGEGQEE